MTSEMRKSERHRVRFKLVYDDGNTFNAGCVLDVSEGGIFLETALPLPVGTEVRLTPLATDTDELFDVGAKVVRVVPYNPSSENAAGMGLMFVGLSDEERLQVVSMIRRLEDLAAAMEGEVDPFLGVLLPSSLPESAASQIPDPATTKKDD